MKKYLVVTFLCFASQAFAVLPPLYQGKKEIEAIFSHPQFGETLPSGDVIQEITKVSSGYLIITNKRIVPVVVEYKKTQQIGPSQFTLEFKSSIDLSD